MNILTSLLGCNVNARDKYGRTPLIFAAKYGFLDLVTYLINNHADMEKFDSRGSTPFSGIFLICLRRVILIVSFLIIICCK